MADRQLHRAGTSTGTPPYLEVRETASGRVQLGLAAHPAYTALTAHAGAWTDRQRDSNLWQWTIRRHMKPTLQGR